MGPKPAKAPAVKDMLIDPNFTVQMQDALGHVKFIRDQLKLTRENVVNFGSMQRKGDLSVEDGIKLLSQKIQNELKERLKDLEETTRTVRNTFGILDPTGLYNSENLNKLDVEMSSINPMP